MNIRVLGALRTLGVQTEWVVSTDEKPVPVVVNAAEMSELFKENTCDNALWVESKHLIRGRSYKHRVTMDDSPRIIDKDAVYEKTISECGVSIYTGSALKSILSMNDNTYAHTEETNSVVYDVWRNYCTQNTNKICALNSMQGITVENSLHRLMNLAGQDAVYAEVYWLTDFDVFKTMVTETMAGKRMSEPASYKRAVGVTDKMIAVLHSEVMARSTLFVKGAENIKDLADRFDELVKLTHKGVHIVLLFTEPLAYTMLTKARGNDLFSVNDTFLLYKGYATQETGYSLLSYAQHSVFGNDVITLADVLNLFDYICKGAWSTYYQHNNSGMTSEEFRNAVMGGIASSIIDIYARNLVDIDNVSVTQVSVLTKFLVEKLLPQAKFTCDLTAICDREAGLEICEQLGLVRKFADTYVFRYTALLGILLRSAFGTKADIKNVLKEIAMLNDMLSQVGKQIQGIYEIDGTYDILVKNSRNELVSVRLTQNNCRTADHEKRGLVNKVIVDLTPKNVFYDKYRMLYGEPVWVRADDNGEHFLCLVAAETFLESMNRVLDIREKDYVVDSFEDKVKPISATVVANSPFDFARNYTLMYKDVAVLNFSVAFDAEGYEGVFSDHPTWALPLGFTDIKDWLERRFAISDRYSLRTLTGGHSTLESLCIAIDMSYALSLDDYYWVKPRKDTIDWKTVSKLYNTVNEGIGVYSVCGRKETYISYSPELTTRGKQPCRWIESGRGINLTTFKQEDERWVDFFAPLYAQQLARKLGLSFKAAMKVDIDNEPAIMYLRPVRPAMRVYTTLYDVIRANGILGMEDVTVVLDLCNRLKPLFNTQLRHLFLLDALLGYKRDLRTVVVSCDTRDKVGYSLVKTNMYSMCKAPLSLATARTEVDSKVAFDGRRFEDFYKRIRGNDTRELLESVKDFKFEPIGVAEADSQLPLLQAMFDIQLQKLLRCDI